MKKTLGLVLVLVGLFPFPVVADETLLQFQGGIGVIPVSNVVVNADGSVTVNRNTVRGVNPAGQIWVIEDLRAEVQVDGRIRVEGRGLLLGGGNSIGGTNNQSVRATLICEAAAPFTLRNTALVPLEVNGDFQIDDVLSDVVPPLECASPVLLIRNAGGSWFAAGIVKHD